MSLADNLKLFRTEKGFTLEELAKSANVSRQAILKYEQNKMSPQPEIIADLADKLGVTCDELIKGRADTNQKLEN